MYHRGKTPSRPTYSHSQNRANYKPIHIKTRVSGPPVTPRKKKKKPKKRVEFLLGRLKSFVHKTIFDSQAFMLSAELLNHQLSEVATQVNSFHPPAEGLLELVRFAGHLFRSMRDATDSMVFFNKSGTKGRILVHRLIQLNLQILVMCEFREISESEVDCYTQKIVEIEQLLSSWSRTFRRLLAEPLSVRVMFRNELEQAKNMLKVLRRHATREGVFQS
ncbi:hypothetical protein JCM33374_g6078 [Metschnikowia sp. JCM 33374]|nr:hypothetical protein JCM33374_g6078 [Metschnikowia sp. JCM 33374]